MRLSTLFLGASSVLLAASPGFAKPIDDGLSKRQSYSNERMTYYEVGGAAGACGQTHSDSEHVVALNAAQYGSGGDCGRSITISYKGKSTSATIVDKCPGCPNGGLDISPSLFSYFADESVGVIYADWKFN
ncbi:uncharacterized protein STEHIDRAFT_107620 [Stereum hirsutum FP-91666 SS1]|uniref:uncharacterized protein n=1 Tax=Stereum hirsutum (strain FP-91666) TaxID=721885 RepID=UPI000440BDDE|nr:uncharacterized protein STEHIDRAFT_107620 [Stereum hirsutum FP-91666 SS1]EIM90914.1 hypothetical protein STEHIDRAFT_107620 [Stereum hirsutum FP-91666 SS1]